MRGLGCVRGVHGVRACVWRVRIVRRVFGERGARACVCVRVRVRMRVCVIACVCLHISVQHSRLMEVIAEWVCISNLKCAMPWELQKVISCCMITQAHRIAHEFQPTPSYRSATANPASA